MLPKQRPTLLYPCHCMALLCSLCRGWLTNSHSTRASTRVLPRCVEPHFLSAVVSGVGLALLNSCPRGWFTFPSPHPHQSHLYCVSQVQCGGAWGYPLSSVLQLLVGAALLLSRPALPCSTGEGQRHGQLGSALRQLHGPRQQSRKSVCLTFGGNMEHQTAAAIAPGPRHGPLAVWAGTSSWPQGAPLPSECINYSCFFFSFIFPPHTSHLSVLECTMPAMTSYLETQDG